MSRRIRKRLYVGLGVDQVVDDGFTAGEIGLMSDAGLLLQKKRLLNKLTGRLAAIEASLRQILTNHEATLPAGTLQKAGKISKGENYRDLPYLVLDYPRLFTKDDILNVRLLFWWGHYFSMSLHLAGNTWQAKKQQVCRQATLLPIGDYFIQTDGSPWENDVAAACFFRVSDKLPAQQQAVLEAPFVKFVTTLPLREAASLESFSIKTFKNFMAILKN